MSGIDVVVPCHQYGRYLRECLTSVLSQDVDDLRVLVIDNASTDDSVEVAQEVARNDARVEVLARSRNLGATASYNEGVDWAEADYFMILDADDLIASGSLSRARALLESDPGIVFAYGTQAFLQRDGALTMWRSDERRDPGWIVSSGRRFIESVCRTSRNPVGAPTVLRRTAAQERAGYYRASLEYCDDMEMWLRLACVGAVARTGAVQAIRRLHDLQMGHHYQRVIVRDFRERERAFESFFVNEGRSLHDWQQLFAMARRALGTHAYWSAVSHLCRGYPVDAVRLLGFALARRPSAVVVPPLDGLFINDNPGARMAEVFTDVCQRVRGAFGRRMGNAG
jgi:glycosyltransferase involved in cell wall biosynthesis